ncbi:hypothetical protein H9649_13705 [Sporosarcina sp. Sa2YVA2]|uniref:DUF2304 domain-containing protein n=1 Tax=Sporosarcina quadrami TaxID=2762234 RepID=A0ABR8UC91_9BACL|nr:hypothetical protein [Sporosarcina quadrami]MBD7985645.1 hypothetical protein [Sporosarcina quadrami]
MDTFMVVLNTLIIISYILLIGFIAPFIMRFLKNRNYDVFIQLIPIFAISLLGSIAISVGLGGMSEIWFFKAATIISAVMLVSLLFLTLAMRNLWKDEYDKLIERIASFFQKNERSFSLK